MTSSTIVATATAPGPAAIAVVRLSGPEAFRVAGVLAAGFDASRAREVRLLTLHDAAGVIDRALVTAFPAPASFTGEDVVEFSCHGGALTPSRLLAACVAAGARQAYPGEFTRRAVVHGKLDLLQAEATGDLLMATAPAQAAQALAQLDGNLSRRVAGLREALLGAEAQLAYAIDFPEEDDGPTPVAQVLAAVGEVRLQLEALLATAVEGERLRTGALVVLAGAPNAGKSSLFNALLGRERALVSEIPGTTRDAIEAFTTMDGYPVRLVDTAGLRDDGDRLEAMGMAHSRRWVDDADVVLLCRAPDTEVNEQAFTSSGVVVYVATKSDLGPGPAGADCHVSAVTGEGLSALGALVRSRLVRSGQSQSARVDEPQLTRERHAAAVRTALDAVCRAEQVLQQDEAVLAASELRSAGSALESLIGGMDREEVLDRVFAGFCIGK